MELLKEHSAVVHGKKYIAHYTFPVGTPVRVVSVAGGGFQIWIEEGPHKGSYFYIRNLEGLVTPIIQGAFIP